jgi:dienelactone hydrolase
VIVMAHGFSGVRELLLGGYAEKFADHGLASLVFDYRHFGASQGEPRQLLSWRRQLDDWRSALALVRNMGEVDGTRIGLWGTSFAGGHAIVTAAEDQHVMAAVAQVPFVDGLASLRTVSFGFMARAVASGLWDLGRALLGLRPYYVPAVSTPDSFGCINTPGSHDALFAAMPPDLEYRNEVTARVFLTIGFYRPITCARKIRCPLLLVAAEKDAVTPVAPIRRLASKASRARLHVVDVDHFDVYTGPLFQDLSDLEANFLAEELIHTK